MLGKWGRSQPSWIDWSKDENLEPRVRCSRTY